MSSYAIGLSGRDSERPVVIKLVVDAFAAGSSFMYMLDGMSRSEEFVDWVEYDCEWYRLAIDGGDGEAGTSIFFRLVFVSG